jgi:hypothetical protein
MRWRCWQRCSANNICLDAPPKCDGGAWPSDRQICHKSKNLLSAFWPKKLGVLREAENTTPNAQTFHSGSYATVGLRCIEMMRMIRERHSLMLESGAAGEVSFVDRLFRLAVCAGATFASHFASGRQFQNEPVPTLVFSV